MFKMLRSSHLWHSLSSVSVWWVVSVGRECVVYNLVSLQLSLVASVMAVRYKQSRGDPLFLAHCSSSLDRRLWRDPCPPATELHLPCFTEPGPYQNSTAVTEKNRLSGNMHTGLGLTSPPAALFCGREGSRSCKKPAIPHASGKAPRAIQYDSQGTLNWHGWTPRSFEWEWRQGRMSSLWLAFLWGDWLHLSILRGRLGRMGLTPPTVVE